MGDLLLCHKETASVPYYVEMMDCNIYSLEELAYFFVCYTDSIAPECMDEELCIWIEQELKLPDLAEKLLHFIQDNGSFAEFVAEILKSSNYCGFDEIAEIRQKLSVFDNKSEIEGKKIRADRLLAQERYEVCIREYQKLLELPKVLEDSQLLVGNIWHNLGTAYAGLFFFEKAKACFESAYRRNANPLSLQQAKEAEKLAEAAASICSAGAAEQMENTKAQNEAEKSKTEIEKTEIEKIEIKKIELKKEAAKVREWEAEYRRSCK